MAISKKILKFLDKSAIKYNILKHRTVYTAHDLAVTLKKKLDEVTKTIVVSTGKGHALVVLPASRYLDLDKLKKLLKVKKIELITEKAMAKIFKIKPGAMVPFGQLSGDINVHIDKALMKSKKLITQAGDFENSFHLKVQDFLKATSGVIGNFSSAKKPMKNKKKN